MSSKTKIMVFRMRELIYTGIFIALGIVLVILMIVMFRPKPSSAPGTLPAKGQDSSSVSQAKYTPGVYTTPITLNDNALDVEVTVDSSHINSIRLVNLSDTVTTMYPLVQPALDELAEQICEKQSTEEITYSEDSRYTSQVLLDAVKSALKTAEEAPDTGDFSAY